MLITDVVMPKMNGKELYQQLTPMFPDLKVLYMSGYAHDVIGHHGVLEEGAFFAETGLRPRTDRKGAGSAGRIIGFFLFAGQSEDFAQELK